MAKTYGFISIDIEKCKGCELCLEECPPKALSMSPNINKKSYHYAILSDDTCTGCTNCALVCPEAIITVYREPKKKHKNLSVETINLKDTITIPIN
ncbi:MAG: ferredoxin family protein [Candidatus Neomarinimicrobiota bacterium]